MLAVPVQRLRASPFSAAAAADAMTDTPWDTLQTFLFDGLDVRGALLTLGPSWREALSRRCSAGDGAHAWPTPVRALLGEMAAASVLLQTGLKFDGALVIQLQGGGPVTLAVAESQTEGTFRVSATLPSTGTALADAATARLGDLVDADGRARCAITLDARGRRRDQPPQVGIVALTGPDARRFDRLEDVLMHHMRQSAQLETFLLLAADDRTAAGLLLQRLPGRGGAATEPDPTDDGDDTYRRLSMLAGTLTREELLAQPPDALLRRLFWQERVRVFPARAIGFACRCSRERVAAMLRSLGAAEVMSLVDERGAAEIGCEFCGAFYRFDAVDAQALFTPGGAADGPATPQ